MGDKTVFISYSWADKVVAERIKNAVPPSYNIWIDDAKVKPGDEVARKIENALSGSDYYLIVISEDAMKSDWVKREISLAFDLSRRKKLALVPFLWKDVEVPLEFRGLLYIDARKSLETGLRRVKDFFEQEETIISKFAAITTASPSGMALPCKSKLATMQFRILRMEITNRLTIKEVGVVWWDVFTRRMEDQTQVTDIASVCVELIDKCRREGKMDELVDVLCTNHPFLAGP